MQSHPRRQQVTAPGGELMAIGIEMLAHILADVFNPLRAAACCMPLPGPIWQTSRKGRQRQASRVGRGSVQLHHRVSSTISPDTDSADATFLGKIRGLQWLRTGGERQIRTPDFCFDLPLSEIVVHGQQALHRLDTADPELLSSRLEPRA